MKTRTQVRNEAALDLRRRLYEKVVEVGSIERDDLCAMFGARPTGESEKFERMKASWAVDALLPAQ